MGFEKSKEYLASFFFFLLNDPSAEVVGHMLDGIEDSIKYLVFQDPIVNSFFLKNIEISGGKIRN